MQLKYCYHLADILATSLSVIMMLNFEVSHFQFPTCFICQTIALFLCYQYLLLTLDGVSGFERNVITKGKTLMALTALRGLLFLDSGLYL